MLADSSVIVHIIVIIVSNNVTQLLTMMYCKGRFAVRTDINDT